MCILTRWCETHMHARWWEREGGKGGGGRGGVRRTCTRDGANDEIEDQGIPTRAREVEGYKGIRRVRDTE